jgi:hypothetical protein
MRAWIEEVGVGINVFAAFVLAKQFLSLSALWWAEAVGFSIGIYLALTGCET